MDQGVSSASDVKVSDSGCAVLQNKANRFVDSLDIRYYRKRCPAERGSQPNLKIEYAIIVLGRLCVGRADLVEKIWS